MQQKASSQNKHCLQNKPDLCGGNLIILFQMLMQVSTQIMGEKTLALTSYPHTKLTNACRHNRSLRLTIFLDQLKVCLSTPCDREKGSTTWVYVAVTHSVDGVLAFSIVLAEEGLSQTVCFGKWSGIRGITEIHHLIDCKEGLVTSLLALAEFLGWMEKSKSYQCLLQ